MGLSHYLTRIVGSVYHGSTESLSFPGFIQYVSSGPVDPTSRRCAAHPVWKGGKLCGVYLHKDGITPRVGIDSSSGLSALPLSAQWLRLLIVVSFARTARVSCGFDPLRGTAQTKGVVGSGSSAPPTPHQLSSGPRLTKW